MKCRILDSILFWSFLLFIISFFFAESIANLTPPITRDELIHHLAIPKLWIQKGGFYETSWADFSYYPMAINLLYVIPLYFKNDIVPKFIHMAFGLGTGWLIYSYLRKRYNAIWAMLGPVIFLTTPIVVWLSTSAYIDLGMTFFTTAALLSLIQWRDTGYRKKAWLVLGACAMGIAVGSKYNALIAWFIVNLTMIVMHVRDENRQPSALGYGILFFIVSAAVASPWYIKNFMLTGNPFYPLFDSVFKTFQNSQDIVGVVKQGSEKIVGEGMGFFQFRGYLYNENFWETLAIPVRMFFQGEDNSYQYFQGRLNPILLLFLPVAFLNKTYRKEQFFFLTFCFCFIFLAFFLTAKQVRYILPVLPFLTILAVMGIRNLSDQLNANNANVNRAIKVCLYLTVTALLIPNAIYLHQHFYKIDPLPYVFGKETRDDFLKRHLIDYEAVQFINQQLPKNAIVYTIYLGRRGYYLEREYRNDPSFGTKIISRLVNSSTNEKEFLNTGKAIGATHIFLRTDLTDQFLRVNFSPEQIDQFIGCANKYWKVLYNKDGFAVWELNRTSR
jgi:hypothetical protein